MATKAASVPPAATDAAGAGVSRLRLGLLRATYALLVAGIGIMILPAIVSHEPAARGVIPSLLLGVWLLSFLGLAQPLRMLPVLMFEFAWKTVWLLVYGLPQYWSGQMPPTFSEDFVNILFGVVLMPIIIPWPYVWRTYVRPPAARGGRP